MSQFGLEYSEKSCLSCKLTLEPSTLPGPYPNIITISNISLFMNASHHCANVKVECIKIKKQKKNSFFGV